MLTSISGEIVGLSFTNEENGYSIVDINADGSIITAVGIFPMVNIGESVNLEGKFINHARYGKQFDVSKVTFIKPDNRDAIIRYLASGLIKGVGEATALLLYNNFKDKTLEVIENEPQKLSLVRGIGERKAKDIADSYRINSEMRDAIMGLQELSMTMSMCLKIYKQYGKDSIKVIKDNPYLLVTDIDGVGFLTADKIAEKLGIPPNSEFRYTAGIIHILKEVGLNGGNTAMPYNEITFEASKLMNAEIDDVKKTLDSMVIKYRVKSTSVPMENGEEKKYISLVGIFNIEYSLAGKLLKLNKNAKKLDLNPTKEIDNYEKLHGVQLHINQRNAIEASITNGVLVITGGPGTGKTTIIKCIIDTLKARGLTIQLTAPTGRASKRLSEATGEDAKTIHRLLGMDISSAKVEFTFKEENPLPCDVLIIDEISMADIFIFKALLSALSEGTRIIMVGDKDQLPSVSAGDILSDIIKSGELPIAFLTEIYRQSSDSLIVSNAHLINHNQLPLIDNKSKDFFFTNMDTSEDIVDTVVSLVADRLPKFFNVNPLSIQVLAPIKKGVAGIENLNKRLQAKLNPYGRQLKFNNTVFCVGDKVMHIKNNYNLLWTKTYPPFEKGQGVYNGDIGIIKSVSIHSLIVEFDDGREAVYEPKDLEELMLAYAISIHKSQGCEFDNIVIALSPAGYMFLNKNLLYTAVTRAKNSVTMVGSKYTLTKMVEKNFESERHTLLSHFIKETAQKMKILFGEAGEGD